MEKVIEVEGYTYCEKHDIFYNTKSRENKKIPCPACDAEDNFKAAFDVGMGFGR